MKNAIYNFERKYSRWGAVCPGTFMPVLTIGVKCSRFRVKAAHLPLTHQAKVNKPPTSSRFSNSQPQMELREREKRETAERIYHFELHLGG
jgi:hypothetical protein